MSPDVTNASLRKIQKSPSRPIFTEQLRGTGTALGTVGEERTKQTKPRLLSCLLSSRGDAQTNKHVTLRVMGAPGGNPMRGEVRETDGGQ